MFLIVNYLVIPKIVRTFATESETGPMPIGTCPARIQKTLIRKRTKESLQILT